MYNELTQEQIIIVIAIAPIFIATLIAFFNFDWLNDSIIKFHQGIEKKHAKSKSGIGKFLLSIFKYPGEVPQSIKNEGWRSGLTFFSYTLSTVVIGGLISAIGFIIYYIIMAIIAIAAIIIGILIVVAIIAAIVSGS